MQEECRAQNLHNWIGVTTHAGKESLSRGFNHFTNKTAIITARQSPIKIMKIFQPDFFRQFQKISELDADLKALRDGFSDTEKDTFAQLIFTHPSLQVINFIPYFLTLMTLCKCWIFPAMTMLMPLLSIIVPYLTMVFIYNMPISIEAYWKIIKSMFVGDSPLKTAFNLATFGATMAQSIVQPIQQSIHAQKTDSELLRLGSSIQEYVNIFNQLRIMTDKIEIYCPSVLTELNLPDDPRQLFAYFYEYKHVLFIIDSWLGDMEVAFRMANSQELCIADVYCQKPSSETFLEICELYDPSVPADQRVVNSIRLKGNQKGHSLLTGPNKGGKSTLLRSLALNCWLAQTFGVAFAKSYRGSAFEWIQTSLRLQDIPGQASRFERECQGAQECLARCGRGLLLIDELFHSTNPPDGEKASTRFLQKLWLRPHILSIISTHMFSLCENVPANIATFCCQASESEDGSISYTYKIDDGICRLSSVEELLVKYRL
jgi:hypothetical protein